MIIISPLLTKSKGTLGLHSVCLSVSPLNQFPQFFFRAFRYSFDIWYIALSKIQTKFQFGFGPLIFHKVMAPGLRKISQILSFPHFFCSCFQYLFDIYAPLWKREGIYCFAAVYLIICSFCSVFLHWLHILKWNLVYRFIRRIYRSSFVLVTMEPFFTVMALGLRKIPIICSFHSCPK
jgi:hypothetical protein